MTRMTAKTTLPTYITYTINYQYFIYAIFILCIFPISTYAQNGIQNQGGAMTLGLADAGVCFDDVSAIYTNQAGIAYLKGWAVDVSMDRKFNLEELTTISLAAAKSLNIGTIGLNVSQYGFEDYAEQKIGLSYARLLTSYLSVGGQLDMLGVKLGEYGSTYKFAAEIGLYSQLSSKIHLGAHIFNPVASKITDNEELDTRMKFGVRYIPSNKLDIFTEVEKIIDRSPQLKLALAYKMLDDLDINIGTNLTVESFHFGFRYTIQDNFVIAAAFSLNNNQIGSTPAVSAQYNSH